jgi:hypothetical protein
MLRSVAGHRVKTKNLFFEGKMSCLIEWTYDEEPGERAPQLTNSPAPRQSKPNAPDARDAPGTTFADIAFEKSNNKNEFSYEESRL